MSDDIEITPFDHSKYLQTTEEQIQYLTECAELNDPKTFALALGHVARARGTMVDLARDTGVTREALYRALSTTGNPNIGTVMKVLAAFGLHMTFAPNESAEHA